MLSGLLACLTFVLTQPTGDRTWGKSFNLTEHKFSPLYIIYLVRSLRKLEKVLNIEHYITELSSWHKQLFCHHEGIVALVISACESRDCLVIGWRVRSTLENT